MKLKKIIESLPVDLFKGSKELEIRGVCGHSKRVSPGDLFLSRRSPTGQEEHYIDEAFAAGAVAVLTDFPNPARKEMAQLVCIDVRAIEGKIASLFFGAPSTKMNCVGVTGTNGKTTTTFLIHHLLEKRGITTGLIGTIEYRFGQQRFPAELTTPEASTLQKCFKEMLDFGCKAVVMEASSIGIDQGRVEEVDFDIALFTNLSQDHLDYHGTMEAYAKAKQMLFTDLKKEGCAIVNQADPHASFMLEKCAARPFRFGYDRSCDLWVEETDFSPKGTTALCYTKEEKVELRIPLLGQFNLENVLGALSTYINLGGSLEEGAEALKSFPGVLGRFERLKTSSGKHVVVDYAHTPDAISRLCKAARVAFKGKITLVVGAGGNRDAGKRPAMAQAGLPYIDRLILTSDNPRMEDPMEICRQMSLGVLDKPFEIEVDRREAIRRAIEGSEPGDLILIAGKGHETTQTIGKISYPFDDRKVALEYL